MSFKISIFGHKITSPTQNDDRDGKFVFQKLVSDDLKWSEMPKNMILKFQFLVKKLQAPPETTIVVRNFFFKSWSQMN